MIERRDRSRPVVPPFLVAVAVGTALVAATGEMPAFDAVPVNDLVYAVPFTLEEGYETVWRRERPAVTAGHVIVVRVDPALVEPRADAMPVLYVGDRVLEQLNSGYPSGFVVGIVPGEINLATAPIWFGAPEFPERIDQDTVDDAVAAAARDGIAPPPPDRVHAALAAGGMKRAFANRRALLQDLRPLLERFGP